MSTSITASTSSPFNGQLLTDANFIATSSFASASLTANTPSLNFGVPAPWPTTAAVTVQVFNTALTNTNNGAVLSMSLQESADNSSWNNIAVFASPLNTTTDNGSNAAPAKSTSVILGPNAKQYLRATGFVPLGGSTTGGVTGSFGVQVLL